MKTLKQCYAAPVPTPSDLLRWSDSIKINTTRTTDGHIHFTRKGEGVFAVTAFHQQIGSIRLQKAAPTVAWAGVAKSERVACEPAIEQFANGSERHADALKTCLSAMIGEAVGMLKDEEDAALKDRLKARREKVKELRRKAKILQGKHASELRDEAKRLARACNVLEVSGLRFSVWPERGAWHVSEYHTGQGFACPSTLSKGWDGDKRGLMGQIRNTIAHRIAEVGPVALVDLLSQSPVIFE